MKKNTFLAFALVCILNLTGVLLGNQTIMWLTKPLMMPLLAWWLYQSAAPSRLRSGWLIGLLFSTLGDVLLMFPGSLFFLLGLSSFLIAHLAYIGAINVGLRGQRGFLIKNPLWILPFMAYPIALLVWLWPGIPEAMRIPVAVYAIVIATMAQSVCNLRGYVPAEMFKSMMLGAVLFVLSDSLIAVNKFGYAFSGAHVAIIATYVAGQWLLARGVRMMDNLN
ncbi:MAG: lysoplasmalogenase [Saprospiraceae bacterium]|nr:lysoplasmalogenase [Saprospiraceae bacterium]